jgi:WD40 repeat protein
MLFSPAESRVRQQFWDQRLPAFSDVDGVDPNWDAHIYTLEGSEDVRGLVFSPDGKLLASVHTFSVRLWNASTGTHLMELAVRAYPSGSIQFSGNSQLLAARYDDQTVRVWDITTWTQVHTLQCRDGRVESLICLSDSQLLAAASSSSEDNQVQIWNAKTGAHQKTITLTAYNHIIRAIAVSPDFQLVATSRIHSISLWNMAASTAPFLFQVCANTKVKAIAFSPDSKILVVACDEKLHFWNTTSATVERTLEDTDMELGVKVESIAFSPDGQLLASSSKHKVTLWSLTTGSYRDIALDIHPWPRALAFSPDNQLLATSSMDHKIELWDTAYVDQHSGGHLTEKRIMRPQNIAFSPNGRFVMSQSHKTLQLWDAFTGTLRWSHGNEKEICDAHFSPDGKFVAFRSFISGDRTLGYTCAVECGTVERMLDSQMKHLSCPVVYSEKAQLIAGCGVGNSIQIHNATTGSYKCTLEGHTDKIHAIAFSPNGQTLVSLAKDGTTRLWAANNGTLKHVLEQLVTGIATRLVFSPNGELLALRDYDAISWWNAVTGVHQCTLPNIDGFGPLAISPDSVHLAITVSSLTQSLSSCGTLGQAPVTASFMAIRDVQYKSSFRLTASK